jgi:transposase
MTLEARVAELEAENAALRAQVSEVPALREQVTALLARILELEAQRAKDSHNSGKPPSTDGLKRRTKSLRRPSGKKAGGQLGHRGETLHLVATPDAVVEHRPAVCTACQATLAEAPVVGRERRQVQEVPPVRLRVTEHQALRVQCPKCQVVSVGMFPTEAPSRAQYGPQLRALAVYLVEEQLVPLGRVQQVLRDLVGVRLGRGTLVRWIQQASTTLAPVEAQITAALRQAPVLHVDETGVRRGGRLAWVHVASTSRLTRYAVHAKRGVEATEAMGLLPAFTGVSVHDGWKPYQQYTRCRHALCNIHHLRELTFLEEQYQQRWATELKALLRELLREMKAAVEQARAEGLTRLPAATHAAFVTRYQAVLAAGHAANPPPARRPRPRAARARADAPSRRQRATCSNASGWGRRRYLPSSTT